MEVDGKEGIDLKSIAEIFHGEDRKWVGVSDKVNEFPFRHDQPRAICSGSQSRCVDLAVKRRSWARDTDLGGITAQITDGAVSEGVIHLLIP